MRDTHSNMVSCLQKSHKQAHITTSNLQFSNLLPICQVFHFLDIRRIGVVKPLQTHVRIWCVKCGKMNLPM